MCYTHDFRVSLAIMRGSGGDSSGGANAAQAGSTGAVGLRGVGYDRHPGRQLQHHQADGCRPGGRAGHLVISRYKELEAVVEGLQTLLNQSTRRDKGKLLACSCIYRWQLINLAVAERPLLMNISSSKPRSSAPREADLPQAAHHQGFHINLGEDRTAAA